MANSTFKHVKVKGITTVIPENFIDIEDEIQYFENNEKKLNRAKKIIGYGRRYIVDELTTVVDLCEDAANKLISEMEIDKSEIDALILVNQSPDYLIPTSACILHGKLNLDPKCATLDVSQGCSGYVYGLWLAHNLIESKSSKKILLLAGDTPSTHSNRKNRLVNQLFGDAASATLLEYSPQEVSSFFSLGTDGKGWDKIIAPATGCRLRSNKDTLDEYQDNEGNIWHLCDTIIKGLDVFNFTIDVVPQNINEIIKYSGIMKEDIDFCAIHQANKQIVETIAQKVGLTPEKYTSEVFTKYGNNSTNSVATVICDKLKDKQIQTLLISAFGVGLSWGSAIIDFEKVYNGGIEFYKPKNKMNREEQIQHWIKHFKGE